MKGTPEPAAGGLYRSPRARTLFGRKMLFQRHFYSFMQYTHLSFCWVWLKCIEAQMLSMLFLADRHTQIEFSLHILMILDSNVGSDVNRISACHSI